MEEFSGKHGMLTVEEVRQSILTAASGEMSGKQLSRMALTWMLQRRRVPYEREMEATIADTIDTLLALDEGPEYDLTNDQLAALAERLRQK